MLVVHFYVVRQTLNYRTFTLDLQIELRVLLGDVFLFSVQYERIGKMQDYIIVIYANGTEYFISTLMIKKYRLKDFDKNARPQNVQKVVHSSRDGPPARSRSNTCNVLFLWLAHIIKLILISRTPRTLTFLFLYLTRYCGGVGVAHGRLPFFPFFFLIDSSN